MIAVVTGSAGLVRKIEDVREADFRLANLHRNSRNLIGLAAEPVANIVQCGEPKSAELASELSYAGRQSCR